MEIKVLLFGSLTDIVGATEMIVDTENTIQSLRKKVTNKFPGMKNKIYAIAINSEITSEEKELKEGDEVAFMPPFAGG